MNRYNGPSIIFFSCLLLILHAGSAHGSAKEFPTPNWLTSSSVAREMIINGIPSTVLQFQSYRKMEELLEFYRQKWNDTTAKKPGYRESNIPPWHIIARLDRQYLYTVQVKEGEDFQITGYLALADLKQIKKPDKHHAAGIPQMNPSQIVNDVTSVDSGISARTLLLANSYSLSSNISYYRNYYEDHGWGMLMDRGEKGGQVLAYRKGGKEAHLVLSRSGGSTAIVMNIITKN